MSDPSLIDPPPILWHYTTSAGAVGILNSRELWFTSFESLNDSSEILYGLARIRERVVVVAGGPLKAHTRSMLELVAGQLADPMATFDRDPQLFESSSVAVCAFSEAADDLSQWRAYGSHGQGCALKIRSDVLRSLPNANGISLVKCLYEEAEITAAVDSMVASFVDDMELGTATSVNQNFWTASVALAARIKHPAFDRECEWRLVRSNLPLYGMETVIIGARPRGVIKLSWNGQRDLVERVVVGPQENAALIARAIAPAIAAALGSPKMFELSQIPFRAR